MSSAWALVIGIALGLRHAADADHVVAVSTLLQREPGSWRAARIAALWGAGHSATFLGLGLLIVHGQLRVPQRFEQTTEVLVALMLIGLGILHLRRRGQRRAEPPLSSRAPACVGPLLIGVVHGLAGSAGIALITASTIPSRLLASAYLGLFGLGTILGMVGLTLVLASAMSWTQRRHARLVDGVSRAAALLSITLGLTIVLRLLVTVGEG